MAKRQRINISEDRKRELEQIALTEEEYELIVFQLGREPNDVELGMFGAMWCEHSAYKYSKALLKRYFEPISQAPWMITKLGEENAGALSVDLALQGRCKACQLYIGREGLCPECERIFTLCPTCGNLPRYDSRESKAPMCCGKIVKQRWKKK